MATVGQDDRAAECRRMMVMLAGYLDPARWPDEPPPPPGDGPCPRGTVADLDMAPAPDPWNGGITPGWRPPPDGAVDPAEVEGLRAQAARLGIDLRDRIDRLRAENWELAVALATVEQRQGATEFELQGIRNAGTARPEADGQGPAGG